MSRFANSPKKILVIRYRFIGDTLLMVPFLRNLRRAYPEAVIDVLVAPNSGEILKHCPYINQLIYFNTTRKHRYENRQGEPPRSFFSYINELKARQYDMAFVLKRSFSSALLTFLAGIPKRIGYKTEARQFLLTDSLPYNKTAPEAECFLDALRSIGVPVDDSHLESWWTDTEESHIDQLTQGVQPALTPHPKERDACHVLLHMTSSNPSKEWPEHVFFHVAQWLIEEHNAILHSVGTDSDASRYQNLIHTLNSPDIKRFYNWCGKTDLLESLSLIKRMNLVIGVDSGTLHMASATGVPVIALFNPENISKWAPPHPQSIVISERDPNQILAKVQDACQTLLQVQTLSH